MHSCKIVVNGSKLGLVVTVVVSFILFVLVLFVVMSFGLVDCACTQCTCFTPKFTERE